MMRQTQQIQTYDLSLPDNQDYRKSLQRLRWFRATFAEQIAAIETRTAIKFTLDCEKLTACFVQWISTFDATKPIDHSHRPAFVGYAAGQMLKNLILKKPLTVGDMPKVTTPSLPAFFWPEGFAYVAYCLNVRQAVLANDFGMTIPENPALDSIRSWWSFKENVEENANNAIAFLDLFAGETPNFSGTVFFDGATRMAEMEKHISVLPHA